MAKSKLRSIGVALIAAERLAERRRQPDLPVVHIRVPSRFLVDPANDAVSNA